MDIPHQWKSLNFVTLLQSSLPLSATLFRSGKHVVSQCPPRLDVQISKPCHWSRVPMMSTKVKAASYISHCNLKPIWYAALNLTL